MSTVSRIDCRHSRVFNVSVRWSMGALVCLAALPAAAGGSPIHRDDILVNNQTAGTQVNPRVVLAPGGPGEAADGRGGGASGYTIGLMWSDWNGGASELQYRELEADGTPVDVQQTFSVTPQWENMNGDLAAIGRGLDGTLQYAFGVEVSGTESDAAMLETIGFTEIRLSPATADIGFDADVRLVYEEQFGRIGMVHTSTHDAAGNPGATILFTAWGALPGPVQIGEASEVNENSPTNLGFAGVMRTTFDFEGVPQDGFLVVWESFGSVGDDASLSSIQGRFVSADGVPVGSQFQVNSYTDSFQSRPDGAMLDDGTVVVVWQSDGSFGDDGSGNSIQARRFATDGTPLGPELQVNNEITGEQYQPAVAALDGGGFVVVWKDTPIAFTDIAGRRFLAGGVPAGPQFQVNTTPGVSPDDTPAVASLGREWVATWIAGSDVYLNGSFLQIFADGFESGDVSVWDASSP